MLANALEPERTLLNAVVARLGKRYQRRELEHVQMSEVGVMELQQWRDPLHIDVYLLIDSASRPIRLECRRMALVMRLLGSCW